MMHEYVGILISSIQKVLGMNAPVETDIDGDEITFTFANVPGEECAEINEKVIDSLNESLLGEASAQRELSGAEAPSYIDPPVSFTGIRVDGNTVIINAEYCYIELY